MQYKQGITITKRVGVRDPESQSMTWHDERYEALVFIDIDIEQVAQELGQKAANNKSKVAREMGKLIKAEVQIGKKIGG